MLSTALAGIALPEMTGDYLHPTSWDQNFPPLAVHEMFFRSAERMTNAPLADFMGRKYSYAEMAQSVRKFARGLQLRGV
ncbi:MAG: hypothetical protein RL481_1157, partial [Pseudomonadota bacterium]